MAPCTRRRSQQIQNSEQEVSSSLSQTAPVQDRGPSGSSLSTRVVSDHVEYPATTPLTAGSDNHLPVQQAANVQPSSISQMYTVYKGRPKGVQNYSVLDKMTLLDSIEQHRPIGLEQWGNVHTDYSEYAARLGRTERTVHSLQDLYRSMVSHKTPTGDPQCPEHVKRAKRLAVEIENGNFVESDTVDSTEGCSSGLDGEQSRGSLTPPSIHTASSSTSTSSGNCDPEAALERVRPWVSAVNETESLQVSVLQPPDEKVFLADEVVLRHGSQPYLKREAADDDLPHGSQPALKRKATDDALRNCSQPRLKREATDDDLPILSATALDPSRQTESNLSSRHDSLLQAVEHLRKDNLKLRMNCKMLRTLRGLLLEDEIDKAREKNGDNQDRYDGLSQEVEKLLQGNEQLRDERKRLRTMIEVLVDSMRNG
ncbi:hypothetical protein EDC01DRAFT_427599 [Geopyxis carbonaria]|nr:hypothetical protein EDC01DRAFT_427599 [Geopyxis carbonaria]